MGSAQDGFAGPSRITALSTQSGAGRSPNSGYWIAPQAQGQGATLLGDMIHSSEWAVALPASVRHTPDDVTSAGWFVTVK